MILQKVATSTTQVQQQQPQQQQLQQQLLIQQQQLQNQQQQTQLDSASKPASNSSETPVGGGVGGTCSGQSGAQIGSQTQQQAVTSALKYMVMAGTAEKMLEHLLETRIDGHTQIGPLLTAKSSIIQHDQISSFIQYQGDNFLEGEFKSFELPGS